MKILFDNQIFCTQKFGGVSRYHIELAKQLTSKFGDRVVIPVWHTRNVYLADYLNKSYQELHKGKLAAKWIERINTAKVIIHLLLKKYDVVHFTWYHSYLIKFCNRQKIIITIHDMIQELYKTDSLTVERKKSALYRADGIIAISENTKRDILNLYPDIPKEKIQVIYHGTNHLKSPKAPKDFKLPEKYVLYVGVRNNYKNAAILMKAMSQVCKRIDDVCVLFIGGGMFSAEEEKLLNELKIKDRVLQKNVMDEELAYIYQNAACFVYPSMYEGFGFPILEAFDNKCPVICSNTSSLPEVGGDAAMYFAPDNYGELTAQIEKVLSDPDLRQSYIERGLERVKEFTWEKTAQETRSFYSKIVSKESARK